MTGVQPAPQGTIIEWTPIPGAPRPSSSAKPTNTFILQPAPVSFSVDPASKIMGATKAKRCETISLSPRRATWNRSARLPFGCLGRAGKAPSGFQKARYGRRRRSCYGRTRRHMSLSWRDLVLRSTRIPEKDVSSSEWLGPGVVWARL